KTAGALAADKHTCWIDQLTLAQMLDGRQHILHIGHAPVTLQPLPIGPAEADAATIIQVGDGKTALGPELDTVIQYRITGRGRPAVGEDHQGWEFIGRQSCLAVAWRIMEAMGNLLLRGWISHGFGAGDIFRAQCTGRLRQDPDLPATQGNAQYSCTAVR